MKVSLILLSLVCVFLFGCAGNRDLTPEQAQRAIQKYMADKGTVKLTDKDFKDLKSKDQFEKATVDGKSALRVFFVVSDYHVTLIEGAPLTVPTAEGLATFIQNPDKTWLLDHVALGGTGLPTRRYEVGSKVE